MIRETSVAVRHSVISNRINKVIVLNINFSLNWDILERQKVIDLTRGNFEGKKKVKT